VKTGLILTFSERYVHGVSLFVEQRVIETDSFISAWGLTSESVRADERKLIHWCLWQNVNRK